MYNHSPPRSLPHTSRQPGESRNPRRIGHDLTAKLDKPRDWMGLGTR
jgi:hypothetical protein